MKKLKVSPTSLLRQAGMKATPSRVTIIEALTTSKKPLSINGIKIMLGKSSIDQATIYRTVETLTSKGLARLVNFQHDHQHYELVDDNHHHHLICENCGKVVDVSKCDTSKLEKEVQKISGFAQINSHALEFFGLCKTCARK
jgi:Fur family ferric uptake transcriptional regulator